MYIVGKGRGIKTCFNSSGRRLDRVVGMEHVFSVVRHGHKGAYPVVLDTTVWRPRVFRTLGNGGILWRRSMSKFVPLLPPFVLVLLYCTVAVVNILLLMS